MRPCRASWHRGTTRHPLTASIFRPCTARFSRQSQLTQAITVAQAPVSGSKKPAIDGTLIFLCGGGDKEYREVADALDAMGKAHHLIGAVGAGAKMKLVVNMIMGAQLCAAPATLLPG